MPVIKFPRPQPGISVEKMIPGGIKAADRWHIGTYDETCSRCRADIPDDDVPLLLWDDSRHNMLAYCEACLGTREQSRAVRALDGHDDEGGAA